MTNFYYGEDGKVEYLYIYYDNSNKLCDYCGDIFIEMNWFTLLQKIMRIQRKWYGLSDCVENV